MFGEFSALLTAFFWTGSAIAFSSATRRAGLFYVNITRLLLAFAVLAIIVLLFRIDLRLSERQLFFLSLSGVIGFAIGDTFLFKAYREIGARITMIVMSLSPAIAAALAFILLDERLSTAGIFGIVITIAGITIVVSDPGPPKNGRHHLTLLGLVCAVLAAAGQGAGLVVAKLALRESPVNGVVATIVRILASLVLLLPFALLTNRYSHPVRVFTQDTKAFWQTGLGAILGPVLGVTFSLLAIEFTQVGIASTIMSIVPILMLPVLRMLYKEHISWYAWAGACTAVGGVAVLFLR
jgi:drug/metabolite transporter (DMT)-like permease